MSEKFEQISLHQGFMKHNGGVMFRNISENEYEFKAVINENHLNAAGITHGGYLAALIDAGADSITLHVEALTDLEKGINQIKSHGCKVGVAVNPATDEQEILPFLQSVDLILVMSVVPGYGGQSFIPASIDKVKRVRSIIEDANQDIELQVDGGISTENSQALINAGATILVAGSFLFSSNNQMSNSILSLRGNVNQD